MNTNNILNALGVVVSAIVFGILLTILTVWLQPNEEVERECTQIEYVYYTHRSGFHVCMTDTTVYYRGEWRQPTNGELRRIEEQL
jgi:hypothetical protein